MEKRLSHCSACQENFARKFKFCPICGNKMAAVLVDADFHVTLVAEKNSRLRNWLLLGAAVILTMTLAGGTIFSIFNKDLDLEELGGDDLVSYVSPIDPLPPEPLDENEKNKPSGSDGGGGGRNDAAPAQKGASATQVDNPLFAPSKDFTKMTDPELKIRAAIQGKNKIPPSDMPYGLTRGADTDSDGQGCCGGQGDTPLGRGGQGNDPGPGLGPRKPNGQNGDDGPNDETNIPQVQKGVTTALKVISKPRANYTDLAREKLTQGKVVLRVTFMPNGQIGNITTVTGLPFGLTEQAVMAARQIKFEPAKVNGRAVSTTKTIEYGFAIF